MYEVPMISGFFGDNRFLSNFWYSAIKDVWVNGPFVSGTGNGNCPSVHIKYAPTLEHAFQSCKADNAGEAQALLLADSPKEAKSLSKMVSMWANWDEIRVHVMRQLVEAKFEQNEELAIRLADTDDHELVEENTWGDVFWGVCRGKGENNLGKILMEVREGYQEMLRDIIWNQAESAAINTWGMKFAENPYAPENSFRHECWRAGYDFHMVRHNS